MKRYLGLIVGLGISVSSWGVEVIKFSTLSAEFTQSVATEKSTLSYGGKLYLKKPDKALWVYTKPVLKEIYITKNQVIVHEPKLKQATITNYKEGLNLLPLLKIAQKVKDGVYRASYNGSDIFIETDGENTIEKMTYKDKLGHLVTLTFSNQATDQFMDNDLFKFKAPTGTDIITQEQ